MFREKLSWQKLKPRLIALALRDKLEWNANILGLEAVSGFEIGLQEISAELAGKVSVKKSNPGKGGKLMRAQGWLNLLEAGRLIMVEGPWNKDFVDELSTFPHGAHDDQIDGVSVAYECLVRKGAQAILV